MEQQDSVISNTVLIEEREAYVRMLASMENMAFYCGWNDGSMNNDNALKSVKDTIKECRIASKGLDVDGEGFGNYIMKSYEGGKEAALKIRDKYNA